MEKAHQSQRSTHRTDTKSEEVRERDFMWLINEGGKEGRL